MAGDILREFIREAEEAKRPLCDQVRRETLEAIGLLADAARHPLIALSDLREAHKHLEKAYAAALELDPPDEPEDRRDEEYHPRPSESLMTEDQRLDDPRHGQADSLNAGRY